MTRTSVKIKIMFSLILFLMNLPEFAEGFMVATAPSASIAECSYSTSRGLGNINTARCCNSSSDGATHDIFGIHCVKKMVSLDGVESFFVLDAIDVDAQDKIKNETNDHIGNNGNGRVERLADYLVQQRSNLVWNQRMVVIGANWVSLLVARLGAANVVVWDDEMNESRLQLLKHADQAMNQSVQETKTADNGNGRIHPDGHRHIEIVTTDNIDETSDADVYVMATTCPKLINDPFVNDVLRRTDAVILMDEDYVDLFCYHARIQEGADIMLW